MRGGGAQTRACAGLLSAGTDLLNTIWSGPIRLQRFFHLPPRPPRWLLRQDKSDPASGLNFA